MHFLTINAIHCHNCGDYIFSRARHDFRFCSCKNVSIGGGTDYLKLAYEPDAKFSFYSVVIELTPEELYEDWREHSEIYVNTKDLENEPYVIEMHKVKGL